MHSIMMRFADAYETILDYCLEDLLELHKELVENAPYTGVMIRSTEDLFVKRVMRSVLIHGAAYDSE